MIRNTNREGLIRSRLRGAGEAKGDVLVFLDAHTECNRKWAEPLLVHIKMNDRIVVQPSVDIIDKDTLHYYSNAATGDIFRGGIGWDLRYVIKLPCSHDAVIGW